MRRRLWIFLYTCTRFGHIAIFPAAMYLAFLLRFDFSIPAVELQHLRTGVVLASCIKALVFTLWKIHRVTWRFVGIGDLIRLFWTNLLASCFFAGAMYLLEGRSFPRSVYVLDLLICFLGTSALRLAGRLYSEARIARARRTARKKILIYGAGAAGISLAREISINPGLRYELIGFLDDNRAKYSSNHFGVKVLGPGRSAAEIVARYARRNVRIAEIVIAMPSASTREMQEALANCRSAGVACKTIPGLGELLSGKVLSAQIRDVSLTDLLGRAPVHIEEDHVRHSIVGKAVLVTGAAGSIGSELCRQIASFEPDLLIAFDQAESELFRVDRELRKTFANTRIIAVLGDVRNAACVRETIVRYSIHSIFHAAAYKHVPMMEEHPLEAVRNNVLGTNNLVQAAYESGVASFLMISSDKAVNPSSVMGATKRVDELILSAMPTNRTRFVSVRFGNVLGSNGSVIPIFQAQINAGGPVTVTHPEMTRFFMTIREAVQLVLLASTMGRGSEVFVLDMGERVKIVDLATQMIRLAGKIPEQEIRIHFTGLRPGEKLYEELSTDSEPFQTTSHRKIRILTTSKAQPEEVDTWLQRLESLVVQRNPQAIVDYLRVIVPEFRCDPRWGPELARAAAADASPALESDAHLTK